MSSFSQNPDAPGAGVLHIVLIGPDEQRRNAVAGALAGYPGGVIREFSSYPPHLDNLSRMLEHNCDVVIVDLDSDPEYALEVVESIYANGSATVIVYSAQANLELAVRCMRAGAREFLTLPLVPAAIADALARISIRGPATHQARKTARKLFVFLGAKGGCGVTTIASNFAVSLAQESCQGTLLIDLGLPLGDAALNLGMVTEYSTVNALENHSRLDASFLSTLLARHSSGLSVLAAPGDFPSGQAPLDAIDKLLAIARQNFDFVVVDAGSRLDLKNSALFDDSANVYLVTQAGISELRNANRLIGHFFASRGPRLQTVLNRYSPQSVVLDDKQIAKALTRPVDWKIPDDYATARRTQNTATPLAMEDSPISMEIRRMARRACGLSEDQDTKKHAGFLGRALHLWKIPSTTPKSGEAQDDPLPSISAPATLGPGHAKF
jgi:pilus assembly protein CpaE